MNLFDGAQPKPMEQPSAGRDQIEWTPVEVIEAQWDKLTAPRREQERLEAERQQAEAQQQTEIAKRKGALPYSDALAQEICERIAIGELLINVCLDEHLPTMRRCNQWLNEHTDFNLLYQSALSDRLRIFEEQVVQIADDMQHDFKTIVKNGKEKRVADPDMVARARLRIEVRFKHLKAGMPSKWGDISTLNVKSQDQFDTSSLSPEQLEAEIADIERKSFISRGKAA
jgi:predicted metal-dependent hydrolase